MRRLEHDAPNLGTAPRGPVTPPPFTPDPPAPTGTSGFDALLAGGFLFVAAGVLVRRRHQRLVA